MKTKLIILSGLFVCFGIFLLVRIYFFGKEQTGRIKIISSPETGVFIDDIPVGKTPYEAAMKPGSHHVKLIPEGVKGKVVSWSSDVVIYANKYTFISRELGASELTSAGEVIYFTPLNETINNVGEIYIDTDPPGALIFLDNDQKGIASSDLSGVAVGDHEVSVYLPGFVRRSSKIKVSEGQKLNVFFKLALDKTYKTVKDEIGEVQKKATAEAELKEKSAQKSNVTPSLTIRDTPTGFLNVRLAPSVYSDIVTTVKPGEVYSYLEDKNGWYKLKLSDKEGWVSGEYIEIKNQ